MSRIFEGHAHHLFHVFKMPVRESVLLFKKAFKLNEIDKVRFLALPCEATPQREGIEGIGWEKTDHLDNLKALYFKSVFSPDAYAFAGLEYDKVDLKDKAAVAKELLRQVKEYKRVGFDGIKMFEGHPNTRVSLGYSLDDEIFDPFYDFCEREDFPVLMHLANSPDMWDKTKVSPYWISRGCYFDESFPTFDELHDEIFKMLEKHPKLRFSLAHFGFFTFAPKERIERFLSYENTSIDITPGGENFFNILADKEYWIPFIKNNIDRFTYGTDFYNFEYESESSFTKSTTARPNLVKNFFGTNTEHDYYGRKFCGIGLEQEMLNKLYYDNLMSILKDPFKIDYGYCIDKCDEYAKEFEVTDIQHHNALCMKNDFISMKENGYIEYFKED